MAKTSASEKKIKVTELRMNKYIAEAGFYSSAGFGLFAFPEAISIISRTSDVAGKEMSIFLGAILIIISCVRFLQAIWIYLQLIPPKAIIINKFIIFDILLLLLA